MDFLAALARRLGPFRDIVFAGTIFNLEAGTTGEQGRLRGNGVMEIFGAAVGIIAGLAILAVALWKFPKFRRDVITAPGSAIAVFALLGGWAGYRIFSMLFHG